MGPTPTFRRILHVLDFKARSVIYLQHSGELIQTSSIIKDGVKAATLCYAVTIEIVHILRQQPKDDRMLLTEGDMIEIVHILSQQPKDD